jgi:hypothetical protein
MFGTLVDDLMGFDDAELTERFRSLELERRRVDAELAAITAVADARRVWATDGHLNVKGWLRANANWSGTEVAGCRRRARLLDALPAVGDALLAGHVGVAQVDELARAYGNRRCGDQLVDVIDQLLDHAEQLPYDDFAVVVRRWVTLADADGALDTADTNHENRTVSLTAVNNAVDLRASGGSPLVTATLLGIFEQFCEAEFRADVTERTRLHGPDAPPSLLPRTAAQRRFDALATIFTTAASTPAGAQAPEPVVSVLVDQWTWEQALAEHRLIALTGDTAIAIPDLSGLRSETDNGITIPPDHVLQAAMLGHIRGAVLDRDGVTINLGRTRRLFTGSARTAAKLLATHCGRIGCTVSARHAQIDHVTEYADGGRTDQDNSNPECGGHNRNKHRLRISARRDPTGKWVHYRTNGTPITPVGQRPIPDPPPDPWHLYRRGLGPDPLAHMPPPRTPPSRQPEPRIPPSRPLDPPAD